ncbi:DUF1136 and I-set and Ig 2 domain containing prot ein [Trichuris trichiura]|uniref:DUF1136 and I-set and Ig 2 domain containing prot ein n=1 Tax=Trichuris trichiura TaxID=36087 RepID=A0A077Z5B7_TRITR|nr:DUF1136 and I-set and Ig 2 domain containing prot ein [Trichuris trichiura]
MNGARVKEGDRVCLQAKVAPKHDSRRSTFKARIGMISCFVANRIKMLFEFGYVSLSFNPVYREDNGMYTCVIRNRAGTSTSTASIVCESEEDIVSKTQHGDSVDSIKRIDNRELRVGPLEEERPEELMSLKAPHFVWNLTNAEVAEGQSVRFQGRVMPSNDPKLNVEWYFNRKPLLSGHRFRPAFDFGYVFLDILYAYPEDSGLYSIVARNQLGECVSEAQLTVKSKKTIYSESQHPDRLDRIEQLESVIPPSVGEQEQEQGSTQMPALRNQLRDMVLQEGANLHLDLRVEPKNDPHMTVDWFLNGHPVLTGSRTHFTFDFGYVALDVKQLIAEDSGQYTVVVRNDRGEVSSTCNVKIESETKRNKQTFKILYIICIRCSKSDRSYGSASAPVFVRPLNPSNSTLTENSRLHLECEVAPKQDSTMTVQWFKNGMPIPTGHRFKPFYDFGFASLDVIGVYPEDSGTYTCVLTNSLGSASSDANFVCVSSVQLATQHPQSYDQILILEAPKQKAADQEELPAATPQFVEKLCDQMQADEGQSVQLQCQVTPKDDPNLSVTWYFNGQPLKFSHRFRHSKDFGYIVLNILYVYPEDSGDYICLVRNGSGSAQSQCHLTCGSKKSMLTETCHPDSLKKIIELETPVPKPEGVEEQFTEPPKFMGDFSSAPKLLNEGDTFQIDCPVEPANDPNMVVEWFFNGKPLVASHRFRPMYQMGFASLEITDVYPEDSGLYTCRARNLNGQAEISAPLQCQGGEQILTQPNQPDSWKLIKEMEEKQELPAEEEIVETAPPHFVQPLSGELTVQEGQPVSFSCQFAPANDPTTSVEWYFNNTPLKQGSRQRHINDFGCVLLEIASVIPTDSGIYTCVARNKNGLDKTSIGLLCLPTGSLYLESQHEESWKKIKAFEEAQPERPSSPEVKFAAPNFTQVLQNVDNLAEGTSVRLQCRLEPLFDPTMKIAWFKNGQPLPQGNFTLFETIDFNTMHQESWNKIQEIENKPPVESVVEAPTIRAPIFVQPLEQAVAVNEGELAHFECRVEPTNDPDLRVLWLHNGRPLMNGHRFRTTHDFGFVTLDILHCLPEDSGTWTCQISNKLGVQECPAALQVAAKQSIQLDPCQPSSLKRIEEIEAPGVVPEAAPEPVFTSPIIVQQMDSVQHYEGQPVHFECRVEPANDPNMIVEWLHNGSPLKEGNRFRKTFDFGYISLDVAYSFPEDSGTYTCIVRNKMGQATSEANLTVLGRSGILAATSRPESWQKIQDFENRPAEMLEAAPVVFPGPKFVQTFRETTDSVEGQPVHLEALVEPLHDNSMRVEWSHNGAALPASSRVSCGNDFGLITFDIAYCLPEDQGSYQCRVVNSSGEAVASFSLNCAARPKILSDPFNLSSVEKIKVIEAPKVVEEAPEPTFGDKPIFTQPLKNVSDVPEGAPAYFECRVTPVNDPNLRIEWFFNGQPLRPSNRVIVSNDFGYVYLKIAGCTIHDSGVYLCKASNLCAEATTTASLGVIGGGNIQLESQHPTSYQKVQELEGLDKFPRKEIPEIEYEKPTFVELLHGVEEVAEGESASLACQVKPADDANLIVEWLLNNQPLPNSSRIQKLHEFGYVALDIVPLLVSDTGIYTCKIRNKSGEASSSASLKVIGSESLLLQSQHPSSWQKIQSLESKPEVVPEEIVEERKKPSIIEALNDVENAEEGLPVVLEARYEPSRDNAIVAEWLKNGQPVLASQLLKTFCELGYCSLTIPQAYADHSGVYTLKLRNGEGEAAASCTVRIQKQASILSAPQHESSWQKIKDLEKPKVADKPAEEVDYGTPAVTAHLNDVSVNEGEPAHFDCQYSPVDDPNLKIEWFCNNKPLSTGSKYAFSKDFGFCTLDIGYAYPEDSGVYSCKVSNRSGEASTSGTLKCEPKASLITDTRHQNALQKIAELEAPKQQEQLDVTPTAQTPIFTRPLEANFAVIEGQAVHFEANFEPINDPSLQVIWLHNGIPVEATSRIKSVSDFGFVVLDLSSTSKRDEGEWKCLLSNAAGSAECKAMLSCEAKESISFESQQPKSLPRIMELESLKEAEPLAAPNPPEPPKFLGQFEIADNLREGDTVHLESQLIPVEDATMKVEWLFNGRPLQFSHRFKPIYDFGFCVLDIMGVRAEDSGQYTCVATNASGRDSLCVSLLCNSEKSIYLDPIFSNKASAVYQLEESLRQKPEIPLAEVAKSAPVFVQPLENPSQLYDGDTLHLEAQLTPTNDPDLKVEWFVNGSPLKVSSRVKVLNDFGFAILEIAPVYSEDSGEYQCRAKNSVGEAVTVASVNCQPKARIIKDTQLPSSMSGAQEKIQALECPKQEPAPPLETIYPPPALTLTSEKMLSINEGQVAHFEFKLEPFDDPSIQVEWFRDGHPISHSSRMKTLHDFGFVVLEIAPAEPHDAGTYVCKATSKSGQDNAEVELKVQSMKGVSYDWLISKAAARDKITELEDYLQRPSDELVLPEQDFPAPTFVVPLQDVGQINEGEVVQLTCQLQPVRDPSMVIEWWHENRLIPYSSRIQTYQEFGHVTLVIQYVINEDSGEYTCRAVNAKGEAVTKICLRNTTSLRDPPHFSIQLPATIGEVKEGDPVHLECRVVPINDPKLALQWLFNGKPLITAHRFKMYADFGFVSLEILYAYAEDSGTFTCRASNQYGTDETSCKLTVSAKPTLILQRQAPPVSMSDLKRHLSQYTKMDILLNDQHLYQEGKMQKPEFLTPMGGVTVDEGDLCRFECQLWPVNDPNMKVEWYHNRQPVMLGHRFKLINDSGYVALVLLYALPVDSGQYSCVAVNKYGQSVLQADLVCAPRKHVDTTSQIPQGKSVSQISSDERALHWVPEIGFAFFFRADTEPKSRPVFTISPRRVQVSENEVARFECAVVSHPLAKVSWFINGKQAVPGSKYKLSYDGMHYLIINRVQPQEAGEVVCIAKNSEGVAQASTTLDVFRVDDFRSHNLKPAKREDEVELLQREERWKQEAMGTLKQAFETAPRADLQKLLRVETEKEAFQPLTTEELQKKFEKKKADDYMEKLAAPEQPKIIPPSGFTETVTLRPTPLQQRQLNLPAVETPTLASWQEEGVKLLSKDKEALFRRLPEKPPEQELPARDQVKLKSVAPKAVDTNELRSKTEREVYQLPGSEGVDVLLDVLQLAKVKRPTKTRQPPTIVQPLQPVQVESGKKVQLTCQFTGSQPLKTFWEKDGRRISDSFEFQVTFPTYNNVGTYTVTVENSAGKVQSSAKVDLVEKAKSDFSPKFLQGLLDIQHAGGETQFCVRVTGKPQPTVLWFKVGFLSDSRHSIKVDRDNYFLLISDTCPLDAGTYECVARNIHGEARCRANLTLSGKEPLEKFAPVFVEKLSPLSVQPKEPVEMGVKVDSRPDSSLQWFLEGILVERGPEVDIQTDRNASTIRFSSDIPKQYTVVVKAENEVGIAVDSAIVSFDLPKKAPTILTQPKTINIRRGEYIDLTMLVDGYPPPKLTWRVNGAYVEESENVRIYETDSQARLVFSTSSIPAKEIELLAENEVGTAVARINVHLLDWTAPQQVEVPKAPPLEGGMAPVIVVPLRDTIGDMEDRVKLSCQVRIKLLSHLLLFILSYGEP